MPSTPKPPPIPRKAQADVPPIDGHLDVGDDTELVGDHDDTALNVGDATELTARPSLVGLRDRASDTALNRVSDTKIDRRPSLTDLDDPTLDETPDD